MLNELVYWLCQDTKEGQVARAWFAEFPEEALTNQKDKIIQYMTKYAVDTNSCVNSVVIESFSKYELESVIFENNIIPEGETYSSYSNTMDLQAATMQFSILLQQDIEIMSSVVPEEGKTLRLTIVEFIRQVKYDLFKDSALKTLLHSENVQPGTKVDNVIEEIKSSYDVILDDLDEEKLLDVLDIIETNPYRKLDDDATNTEFIVDSGVPAIDGDIGGLFETNIQTITGQPGGGKTRFALTTYVYRALIKGYDVLYDRTEMSDSSVRNILVAYHIMHMYDSKFKVTDASINRGELSPEQKRLVEAAREDLFRNPARGKFIIRSGIPVERMFEDTKKRLKRNKNIKVWVVDYAGNVLTERQSKFERELDKTEIITRVYSTAIKINNTVPTVGVLIINQFNKEGIDAALMGKIIQPGHVQGGQVVQQSSTYDMHLTYTHEQKLRDIRMLQCIKARGAKGFLPQMLKTDLSVSIFRQVASE